MFSFYFLWWQPVSEQGHWLRVRRSDFEVKSGWDLMLFNLRLAAKVCGFVVVAIVFILIDFVLLM